LQGRLPASSKRSAKWPLVRGVHLKLHPECAICGNTKKCEVHHKQPFHLHPELELEPSNLITLCEKKEHGINCHLLVGHLGNYKNFNPSVESDSMIWNAKLKENNQPKL
jgi:5-methylcytosine-specific restriction enzyme A